MGKKMERSLESFNEIPISIRKYGSHHERKRIRIWLVDLVGERWVLRPSLDTYRLTNLLTCVYKALEDFICHGHVFYCWLRFVNIFFV